MVHWRIARVSRPVVLVTVAAVRRRAAVLRVVVTAAPQSTVPGYCACKPNFGPSHVHIGNRGANVEQPTCATFAGPPLVELNLSHNLIKDDGAVRMWAMLKVRCSFSMSCLRTALERPSVQRGCERAGEPLAAETRHQLEYHWRCLSDRPGRSAGGWGYAE